MPSAAPKTIRSSADFSRPVGCSGLFGLVGSGSMVGGNALPRCAVAACRGISESDPTFREGLFGQILHGCATSTHAVRAAIQRSKAPLKELAAQHGLNAKTVAKWRKRAFIHDADGSEGSPVYGADGRGGGD